MYTKIRQKCLYYLLNLQKIVRHEILHVQCTTLNAVIPFCKLTGGFKSENYH
jgi:hypothetical protein